MAIEVRTARTLEIDEIDDAVDEILQDINPDTLKKNSAGIVLCHLDYVESGVIEALHEKLGFDIIGQTSNTNASDSGYDMYGLSLAVLTSDDIVFKGGSTDNFKADNFQTVITETYQELRNSISADPALTFVFLPNTHLTSGAEMIRILDEASNGVPFWGSLATGPENFDAEARTIFNGQFYSDAVSLLLLDGDLEPEFFIQSIPKINISERLAIITKCDRYHIIEVNDQPVIDWLNSFGLDASIDNVPATNPLLVYHKDATEPVALGTFAILENGSVLMGGEVQVGATVTVGTISKDGIINGARDGLKAIEDSGKKSAFIMPCITRYFALAPNLNEEIELIQSDFIPTGIHFIMGYAGGEVCPVKNTDGKYINRFHNYTLTACAL